MVIQLAVLYQFDCGRIERKAMNDKKLLWVALIGICFGYGISELRADKYAIYNYEAMFLKINKRTGQTWIVRADGAWHRIPDSN